MPAGEVFIDIYADHGCSYAPSCLNCPFDVCRYDRGFAGNRVSKAMSRVDRDRRIAGMRARCMQIEQIASECGVSGRTVARILSRQGPSRSDVHIVREFDTDAEIAASARRNGRADALEAMGVKSRERWPELRAGANQKQTRCVYASNP